MCSQTDTEPVGNIRSHKNFGSPKVIDAKVASSSWQSTAHTKPKLA
jgi:hypothetical protein